MVGATRQWVTISLKRLSEQGVVATRRTQIVLLRPDILAQMRGGEGMRLIRKLPAQSRSTSRPARPIYATNRRAPSLRN